ncbi:dihydropteroate synthase [Gemmatimonadota bacterium]
MTGDTDSRADERGAGAGLRSSPSSFLYREVTGAGWLVGGRELDLSSSVVMGIVNVTPDSFSDGGDADSPGKAVRRARRLVAEGAGILDIGGESTRPGADPVSRKEELRRVIPVVEAVVESARVPVSVDTRHALVAEEALAAGALILNDVSGLRHDPGMVRIIADAGAALVLSHMRGTPSSMQELAVYDDVVGEVVAELRASFDLATSAGVDPRRVVVDPGIGFAKTGAQSLRLLSELGALIRLGRPVLVGPSRKSFIGEVTGVSPKERVPGTVAACVMAYLQGARLFRVHDVAPVVQALAVTEAIVGAGTGSDLPISGPLANTGEQEEETRA